MQICLDGHSRDPSSESRRLVPLLSVTEALQPSYMGIVSSNLQDNPQALNHRVSSAIPSMTSASILIGMCYQHLLKVSLTSMVSPLGTISWHQLGTMVLFNCGRIAKS